MYDCTSGNVLIDGRPLGEFALSSYRAATSVMYQDYNHLPLTVRARVDFYFHFILGPISLDP